MTRKFMVCVVLTSLALLLPSCGLPALPPPQTIPDACLESMIAAENEETMSDSALLSTLDSCETADIWIAALQSHPGAGSLISYTRDDAVTLLDLACVRRIDAPVCIDASEQGLLSFELDDPQLPELQIPRT